jgi:Flp pilus assembly protein TadD/polyferredoxin
MPIPKAIEKTCGSGSPAAGGVVSLPVLADKRTIRASKMGPIRAAVLIGVHVVIALHILAWVLMGMRQTVSPVEPSESMYTLEEGLVNAGFVFFGLAIVSTLVFGRWFCGWACHVVALQDFCGWIMKKCGVKPKPFRSRLLVLAPLCLALYMFVWPTVKREVVKPLAGAHWETLRPLLGEAGIRPTLVPAFTKANFWETFPPWYVAIPFFGVCGFAAVYFLGAKGYCTYGCPYGGIFGPVDRLAAGRIRVTDACEHCGHCTAVCTSNVRVHEEVRDFGMVVDPGCMKCMDCVSVCPNDALYFGFGAPSLRAQPRTAEAASHPRFKARVYDLSWPQELLAAAGMLFFVICFRNMFGEVSILMAMGLAAISVFFAWKLWQLVREPSVRVQSLQLKLKGAIHPVGLAFAALALATLGAGLWSGAVRYAQHRAAMLDEDVKTPAEVVLVKGYRPDPADAALAEQSLAWFRHSGPRSEGGWGWALSPDDYSRMAWLTLVTGRLEEAQSLVERGIEAEARRRGRVESGRISGLATIMGLRGSTPDQIAAAYERILSRYPELAEVRVAVAYLRLAQGRGDDAAVVAETAFNDRPHDAGVALGAAEVLLRTGRAAKAEVALRGAIADNPRNAALPHVLGIALTMLQRPEEAVAQFERASRLDPKNPEPMTRLAVLLRELGRPAEAAEWEKKAAQAGPARGGP